MNAVDPALHRGERRAVPLCRRALMMADAIREIVCRDGGVTEMALIGSGFTAAEIVELYAEAEAEARRGLYADGARSDRVPEIIEKAVAAMPWMMPLTASTPEGEAMRLAWRDYCTAMAAYKLDPWVSQSERCIVRLGIFLGFLPLIPTERNRILSGVAASLKRRVPA